MSILIEGGVAIRNFKPDIIKQSLSLLSKEAETVDKPISTPKRSLGGEMNMQRYYY